MEALQRQMSEPSLSPPPHIEGILIPQVPPYRSLLVLQARAGSSCRKAERLLPLLTAAFFMCLSLSAAGEPFRG